MAVDLEVQAALDRIDAGEPLDEVADDCGVKRVFLRALVNMEACLATAERARDRYRSEAEGRRRWTERTMPVVKQHSRWSKTERYRLRRTVKRVKDATSARIADLEARLATAEREGDDYRAVRGNDRAWTAEDYENYRLMHVAIAEYGLVYKEVSPVERNEEIAMLAVGQQARRYGVDIVMGSAARQLPALLADALVEHDNITAAVHGCDSGCWSVEARGLLGFLTGTTHDQEASE